MTRGLSRRELLSGPSLSAERVHIASLLVQARPERRDAIAEAARELGAELHVTPHPGKFAVLLEAGDERSIAAATDALLQVSGVLTVSIVAHLIEDAAGLDDAYAAS